MAAPSRRGIFSLLMSNNWLSAGRWQHTRFLRCSRGLCTKGDDPSKTDTPTQPDAGEEGKKRPEQIEIFQKLEQDRQRILEAAAEKEKEAVAEPQPQIEVPKRETRTFTYTPTTQTKARLIRHKTNESNPANQTDAHEGLIYSISNLDMNKWLHDVFDPQYYNLAKAFRDNFMMVRKPAVEIMKYLKMADYNTPVVRYVLWGHSGAGKVHTLGHVMHYCGLQDWMVVHCRWPPEWLVKAEEITPSLYREGRWDTPEVGVRWLAYFKYMNEDLMKAFELKSQHRYVWSKREVTEIGAPWMELIETGLNRPLFACDVIGALIKEIKFAASQGTTRVLVAVGGGNALWGGHGKHKKPVVYTHIPTADYTLTHNFKKLVKNDWTNGAILLVVEQKARDTDHRDSHLPKYLLNDEGFEALDPHIPIHVPEYNDREVQNMIDFYVDNNWIQNPEGRTEDGKNELIFMSQRNPVHLYLNSRAW